MKLAGLLMLLERLRKLCLHVGIERVRLADRLPISFDETFLPLDIGEQVLRNHLRTNPIFTLLEKKYGIPLVGAEYKFGSSGGFGRVS